MSYEALKNETIGLSDDKMIQLIDFARYLKNSMLGTAYNYLDEEAGVETIENKKQREIGFMSGDFVCIADDFDTCLEGMEEYI